jgi:hypothetical protein
MRGERWYAAHRSHYYQRLVQGGLAHAQVTGLYAGLAVAAAAAALAGLAVETPLQGSQCWPTSRCWCSRLVCGSGATIDRPDPG